MKKKLLFVVLAVALMTTAMAACFGSTPEKEPYIKPVKVVDYAQVHGGYLGVVEIIVDAEGDIVDLKFDEIFYPHTWALNTNLAVADFTDKVTIGSSTYAKYIKIGDKFFQIKDDEAVYFEINAQKQAVTEGITDLEAALATDAQVQAWYYQEATKRDSFRILKSTDEGFVTEAFGINNSYGGLFKSSSTYWAKTAGANKDAYSRGIGWKANIDAIIKHYMEEGVITMDEINGKTDPETNKSIDNESLSSLISGATLGSDWPQYLKLITGAYNKAMQQIETAKADAAK